ncbi:hypothetical protein GOP47_0010488 [Adiantum capillus-veneris]|uniref:HIG1 domain-containing protein n=1 Tax=Adiantum capillus-veneris TaxID=13818 RepID=A0A9D4ZHU0_ADICA|nr:hypothetical protein GOP47_0010488 [Adiantum capillus-veneris]
MADDGPAKESRGFILKWINEHRLGAVGILWMSGLAASLAYESSKPLPTSVKILHARVHAQAITLAALAGASAVEYYEHRSGQKAKRYEKHF